MQTRNITDTFVELTADEGMVLVCGEQHTKQVAVHISKMDNWTEVNESELPQQGLAAAREALVKKIDEYDKSDEVNQFSYKGIPMWFAKADRVGLRNSLNIEKRSGKTESTMWFGDTPLVVNIDEGLQLLDAIELYALNCYNVTARHKAEAAELKTIEACQNYDYKSGYPEKLNL